MIAKYEFIDAQKALFPIVLMCAWAGVSRSGFYDWLTRPASATGQRRRELEALVAWVFDRSDGTYGYRRVHAELARRHEACSPELVRAIMRDLELYPCQPKPFRPTTTTPGDPAAVPDLVRRDFTAEAPGTKLVGDITYIPTWRGWAYLATVIDCHTKACIGWAIAEHMRTDLVVQALDMAAGNYRLADGCIFHSDRGTQYMSEQFAKRAAALGIRRSVGRTGVCYDNALAESFNAALKVERVNRTQYPTFDHPRRDIVRYIEFRYNRRRLHSGPATGHHKKPTTTISTLNSTGRQHRNTHKLHVRNSRGGPIPSARSRSRIRSRAGGLIARAVRRTLPVWVRRSGWACVGIGPVGSCCCRGCSSSRPRHSAARPTPSRRGCSPPRCCG